VVIDVLRAFTSAAFMVYLGVEKIILFADPDEVLEISHKEGTIAVGEVGGKKVKGFDLGNSPTQILSAGREYLLGRTVALRSTAGVQGALAASQNSDMVILGSYVTAKAISSFLEQSPQPARVSLAAMGDGDKVSTPDDEACADYIEHLLLGKSYNPIQALQEIFNHEFTQIYLSGDEEHFPITDVVYSF